MNKVPADNLTQQRLDLQAEAALRAKFGVEAIQCLVAQQGWLYAKRIALAITKDYECNPPKTGEDQTKWQTYNTIRWAFERFFSTVEGYSGKEQEPNDGSSNQSRQPHIP